jgi:hypothetical protein
MAANVSTIEVDRPPAEVFAYVINPSRFSEWQHNVVGGHIEGKGPPQVGDKCVTKRRIGFAERPGTSEVTERRRSGRERVLALARCDSDRGP